MNRIVNSLILITVVGLELLAASAAHAQQPLLQITSPANGRLATEGQTITITVSADPSVQNVYVITQIPLPDVQATSQANQFTLTLPTTIPPGLYNLTAVGTNARGDVESAPVAIDVERQFLPIAISANPPVLALSSVGDQFPIRVIGTFRDGTTLDVTHSTHMVYTSNGTQVVTVSSSGMATAAGPGQTSIMVQAGSGLYAIYSAILVQVPQQVPTGAACLKPAVGPGRPSKPSNLWGRPEFQQI